MKKIIFFLFFYLYQYGYGLDITFFPEIPLIFLERKINLENSQHVLQLIRIIEIYPTLLKSLDLQIQQKSMLEDQTRYYRSSLDFH